MSDVLAVVTNYRSPATAANVVQALAPQDCDVVVVDNSPRVTLSENHEFRGEAVKLVKDVWRFTENLGPPCRFWPALATAHRYRYVLFCDDDLKLGDQAVDLCLDTAAELEDRFATLGCNGRNYAGDPPTTYVRRKVRPQPGKSTPVDLTCCYHFVRADMLNLVSGFRNLMARHLGADSPLLWEDDMLLCQGIQRYSGWPSFLVPAEERVLFRRWQRKPGPSMSARPCHVENRTAFMEAAHKAGWRRCR